MRKQIYIRNADLPILADFELQQGNLSALFSDALKRWQSIHNTDGQAKEADQLDGWY